MRGPGIAARRFAKARVVALAKCGTHAFVAAEVGARRTTTEHRRLTHTHTTNQDEGGASPNVPRGPHLAHEHGQPRPSPHQTRLHVVGHNPVIS